MEAHLCRQVFTNERVQVLVHTAADGKHLQVYMCSRNLTLASIYKQKDQHGNACGSIAVVHSICNNASQLAFTPGSPLLKFAQESTGLDCEKLADRLQAASELHAVTETVAATGQTETPDAEDDVNHHFITFVRSAEGHLLELDGMKQGPVDHGPCTAEGLFEHAIRIIRDDMMTKTSNVNFVALALTTAPEED